MELEVLVGTIPFFGFRIRYAVEFSPTFGVILAIIPIVLPRGFGTVERVSPMQANQVAALNWMPDEMATRLFFEGG